MGFYNCIEVRFQPALQSVYNLPERLINRIYWMFLIVVVKKIKENLSRIYMQAIAETTETEVDRR